MKNNSNFLVGFLGVGFVFFLLILLLAISPMIVLWSLNTYSEQAHWGWYIPHNVWTYLATYGLFMLRGVTYKNTSKSE